jgi:DNA-binding NarL/FixJ family response regulator
VSETLLQTKLYIPPLRPNLVPRPRLIERLNQGLQLGHRLTLISAPAGFGKTTLVSEWVADGDRAGACGYLLKDIPAEDLARAVRLAHSGVYQLAPEVAGKLVGAFEEASARAEATKRI